MPTARQVAAAAALGRAVRSGSQPGTPGFAERIRLLPAMLRDTAAGRFPGLSKARLAVMLLGILYIVSPVDLLPESALFLLGMTDDVLVAGWVVSAALDAAGEYALWRRLVPATATTAQPSSSRTASTVSASPAALSAR
jgi:uncharacterized membrane protein YkvA (DUF1232 family)